MKKSLNWFIAVMLFGIILPMASCEDDKHEVEVATVTAENILGKWPKGNVYKTIEKAEVNDSTSLIQYTALRFVEGGTLYAFPTDNDSIEGTWTLSGKDLRLTVGTVNETCEATYRGINTNVLCIGYATKGLLYPKTTDANVEVEPEVVDVRVNIHYKR